jgi:nitrate/nitrite transport system ATP-binding protein
MSEPILSLRGITKRFTDGSGGLVDVLADVDLDVMGGEFVAILGSSGSGKSTLVAAIAGLIDVDAGEVLVRGKPSTGPGADRGVVFQNYSLMPWLTVEGNVRLAVDAVHGKLGKAQRQALTDEVVELVGLTHARDRKPAQLSGGMRQRVAVARALAMRPEILLLDEPLSALDALTRARLQDEIERIRAHDQRTIVLVTNDVDEALLLADRIAILGPGPAARIARTFDVTLPRPRLRSELNSDSGYKALRNDIVAYLGELGKDAGAVVARAVPAVVAEVAAPAAAEASGRPTIHIEFTSVKKVFPTASGPLAVVDDFTLGVARGEVVSLIGHSGCGKSTLLSMAAGLSAVSDGRITIDGRVIDGAGPDKAMVFQSPSLLPWLSARQNVALGVDSVYKESTRAERRDIVEHHLHRVGLGDVMDKPATELSNGMRQRVGLARAFALKPALLLLDEPFGMLDSLTRWDLQDVLLDIWQQNMVTTICVTHDVDEAILLADRVVMMTNGPRARIGRVLEVDLPRPRDRHTVLHDPTFYGYRQELLQFLADNDHVADEAAA